jgi:uncharacterized protein (TIGR00369 family)
MDDPPRDVAAVAFASPFHRHLRFRLLEWREGFARVACDLAPELLNRAGIAHGGVVLALLDEAGGAAGNWCSVPGNVRRSVTVDLNGRFCGQPSGGVLIATGRVASHGRNLYFAQSEIHTEAGALVAFGSSTHRWRSGSLSIEGVAPDAPFGRGTE